MKSDTAPPTMLSRPNLEVATTLVNRVPSRLVKARGATAPWPWKLHSASGRGLYFPVISLTA